MTESQRQRAEFAYEWAEEPEMEMEQEERRDYAAEAHAIAMDESMLLPERAHIKALRAEIDYFESQLNMLRRQNEMLRAAIPAPPKKAAAAVDMVEMAKNILGVA